MPRKKQSEPLQEKTNVHTTAAVAERPASLPPVERPGWIDGPTHPMVDGQGPRAESIAEAEPAKQWGPPYKSIFSCAEMGFELGENRRFKQRVFTFGEKPSEEILAQLKESGFTYRAAEKAWTVPANAENRKLTDELARAWAGPSYVHGIER